MLASAANDPNVVLQIISGLGPAGATFAVMWLWLQSVRNENKTLHAELTEARKESIETLERVLPLVTEVSQVVDTNKREAVRAQQDRQDALLNRLEQKLGRLE